MGAVWKALEAAIRASGDDSLQLVKIPSIYPEGGERQLIEVLTGQQVPEHGYPSDIGLLCQNVATAACVASAIVEGKPLIERYVTVTGNAIRSPRNLLALLGTSVAYLAGQCDGFTDDLARLIIGGPMMGYALPDAEQPLVKAGNCLLALTQADVAPPQDEMPCIRCGECARVCPAQLLPQELHRSIKAGQWDATEGDHLAACIECGCCDFVCPSHIPLVEWFRFGKGELIQQKAERAAADHARDRHLARETRLERQKLERKARMAARKAALKQKANQAAAVKSTVAANSTPDETN
jgi:electron transport complex protein RnfC